MPRRRVKDLAELVEEDDIDDCQHVDITFIPGDHESSDGDSDCNLYEDISSQIIPTGSYEHVKNTYTNEIMVKYYGRFGIKQCIRNKPIRFGFKVWALCSSDGYIYELDIYTGKAGIDERNPLVAVGLGSRVVMKLLSPLLEVTDKDDLRKYHIYFDNFFTSPDLMVHLDELGLSATGTVKQNRVKEKVEMPKKAERGTTMALHDSNSNLNYITVMDSKPVSVLSTKYGDEPKVEVQRWHESSKKSILFPQAFSMYNRYMGGVDLHDQHCNALTPTIKSKKWMWCLFVRLIQAALTNSTVIYNKLHPELPKGTKDLMQEVCQYYLDKFSRDRPVRQKRHSDRSSNEHKIKIVVCNDHKNDHMDEAS
ncbi:piggyBac transposable element-derived protein 3-like [Phymastichus coffea]|uniref:piggyBac transposable element-derived protein 3-like n=1 Tax=Phymastichus coffea TaxID=108790 RepID=UPI00273B55FD|nr:piggyBac transposable element-derived protein 3-like [Phymastichus coffea]